MPVEQLSIQSAAHDGIDILTLTGALTLRTLFDFQEAAQKVTGPKTILDMTGLTYCDSAGLGAILSFHAACKRNNRKYALVGVTPRVQSLFQISRIDKMLTIFGTLPEAEEALAVE